MSKPTPETKLMTIHVMHVGREGETGDGSYVYRCVPKITSVTEPNTPIMFQLGEETTKNYEIKEVICSDYLDQISPPELADDGRSVTVIHKNTQKSLISFSVVVADSGPRNRTINCDPQATNVPPAR